MVLLVLKKIVITKPKARKWFDWGFVVSLSLLLLAFIWIIWQFISPETIGFTLEESFHLMVLWTVLNTLSFLGFMSLPFMVLTLSIRVFFKRELAGWLSRSLLLLPLGLLVGFLGWIWFDEGNSAFASRYFQLHAAIKNTCLLDPQRNHCPTQLVELSYIEPQEFKHLASRTDFTYTYDAATNQYTFIARPSAKRAVVFDQRLIETEGVDFKEYTVSTWGQDRLDNPPPFSGPWELPEWDHWWGK